MDQPSFRRPLQEPIRTPSIALSRALVASFVLSGVVCVVSALGPASAQEGSPLGCWRHESDEGKYKNFLEICLGQGGAAETTEFWSGSGWVRKARWEVTGSGTLSLKFASDSKVVCQFGKAEDAKLALSECSISDYSRIYTREGTFDDRGKRQSICWGRQYPADGSFEVAQLAERTPAIVELEHKQVDDDRPSAEEGAVVVVWRRVGQYACVENLTDDPGGYQWVEQNTLKSIPGSTSGEDPWPGLYKKAVTVEISSAGDGKYDVYGELDHTHGHGPGWGYTISNEIFAYGIKPQRDSIQVSLRRDISTAGSKAPPSLTSPGFIDERCKPMLFVNGPVLLVKDIGDCGDGSVFEGYWLRRP